MYTVKCFCFCLLFLLTVFVSCPLLPVLPWSTLQYPSQIPNLAQSKHTTAVVLCHTIKPSYAIPLNRRSLPFSPQYDELRHDLSGPVEVAELSAWVARLSPRLLLQFGDDTADAVFDSAGRGTLLLFVAGEGEEFEKMTEAARTVAKDHRGEVGSRNAAVWWWCVCGRGSGGGGYWVHGW